jgi:hypothetical protein
MPGITGSVALQPAVVASTRPDAPFSTFRMPAPSVTLGTTPSAPIR